MRSLSSVTVAMPQCSAEPAGEIARFNYVAIFFHWIVAALILTNILIAWQFSVLHGTLRFTFLQLHKSIGISILILSVLRLTWRLLNPPPPFVRTMHAWEMSVAKLVERSFYFVMLAMPLTGWAIVSTSDLHIPTILFWVARWPDLPMVGTLPFEQKLAAYSFSVNAHHLLARMIYALFALHVLAALRHHLIKRDSVLARMIPFLAPRRTFPDLRHR